MTQPLTERMDAALKATEGHTPGDWHADYVGDNSYLISSATPGTLDGNLQQIGLISHMPDDVRTEDAALIAAAPTLRALLSEARATIAAQAEAPGITPIGGTTMTHEFPIGARIILFASRCPIDDTTDGEDENEFRDEPAVVVEHLNGDPAADYLVYVPKTRCVYPCVPADMAAHL